MNIQPGLETMPNLAQLNIALTDDNLIDFDAQPTIVIEALCGIAFGSGQDNLQGWLLGQVNAYAEATGQDFADYDRIKNVDFTQDPDQLMIQAEGSRPRRGGKQDLTVGINDLMPNGIQAARQAYTAELIKRNLNSMPKEK